MWVSALRLTDFRSYASLDITLSPGVTTLIGANGQGKTNVVEALSYPAILGSHRVSSDAPLVRRDCERAILGVTVERDDRSVLIELEVNPGKANRARINRAAATRARDVLGILTTVVFAPEDLALVKGDPSDRRRFLDDLMIQRSPRMQGVRSDYERVLKQRNALLKSITAARRAPQEEVLRTMEVWDAQLADVGSKILAARMTILSDMAQPLARAYALIAGGEDAVSSPDLVLGYQPSTTDDPGASTSAEVWRDAILDTIERRRKDEWDRGITLVGPHRDDLTLTLGDLPAKGYASHGESWSIALALRLASFDLLAEAGEEPVLVLDDVFAELDSARRSRLAARAQECTQVIITAAVPEDIPAALAGDLLQVTRGAVTRVGAVTEVPDASDGEAPAHAG